ncbi:MAG: helix-turn-helix domain-containing protein [Planctomycetota bacterium]|nr:helix-turn-helix domain-containing protein [Planctomycetota bacterium]
MTETAPHDMVEQAAEALPPLAREIALDRAMPLLVRARQAARMCGVGERTWRRWHAAGLVPAPVRVGGAVLWRVSELVAWTQAGAPSRAEWARQRAGAA